MPLANYSTFSRELPGCLKKTLTDIVTDPLNNNPRSRGGKFMVSIASKLTGDITSLEKTVQKHMYPQFSVLGTGVSILSDAEHMLNKFHNMRNSKSVKLELYQAVSASCDLATEDKYIPMFIQVLLRRLHENLLQRQVEMAIQGDTEAAESLSENDQNILMYISGYIIEALSRKYYNKEEKLKVVRSLASKGGSSFTDKYREFTKRADRGDGTRGLKHAHDNFFFMVRAVEMEIRQKIAGRYHQKTLLVEPLVEHLMCNFLVKHHWNTLVLDICEEATAIQLMEQVIRILLKVRGFATAKRFKRELQKENKDVKRKNKQGGNSMRRGLKVLDTNIGPSSS